MTIVVVIGVRVKVRVWSGTANRSRTIDNQLYFFNISFRPKGQPSATYDSPTPKILGMLFSFFALLSWGAVAGGINTNTKHAFFVVCKPHEESERRPSLTTNGTISHTATNKTDERPRMYGSSSSNSGSGEVIATTQAQEGRAESMMQLLRTSKSAYNRFEVSY